MPERRPILIAEDEENDVLLMQRALRHSGSTRPVLTVHDGETALAYLKGEGIYQHRHKFPIPALLLLDLKMPKKSGFEVLSWIRSQPGLRRLLVVVLTSSRETRDINLAYDLGANSYLVKPGPYQDFVHMVSSLHQYWLKLNQNPDWTVEAA